LVTRSAAFGGRQLVASPIADDWDIFTAACSKCFSNHQLAQLIPSKVSQNVDVTQHQDTAAVKGALEDDLREGRGW